MSRVLMFTVMIFLVSAGSAAGQNPPVKSTEESTVAQPPSEAPPDARAMSADEVATYQTQADSTAQSPQVQEMNVGADVNWTIVLSVLVALLIFAVVVAVL